MMATMIVAVVGASQPRPESLEKAEAVGRELAKRGCTLICGGLGGIMEAACRGAREAGGRTVGVLPGRERGEANQFVELAIVTGMGEARNLIIVLSAEAVIAIDGGYGTLSEIAFALANRRPVVGLSTWKVASEALEDVPIYRTEDPLDAVEQAIRAARGM